MTIRRFRLFTLLLAIAAACDSPAETTSMGVAAVEVNPNPAVVTVEDNVQLEAIVLDQESNPISGVSVFWSSEDPSIATVTDGQVHALKPGTVRIAASAEGVSGVTTIVVEPKRAKSVSVSPAETEVYLGDRVTLEATPRDGAGNPLSDREISWKSLAPSIATVNEAGEVLGIAPGSAEITASADGVTGRATVTVLRKPVDEVTITPESAALFIGETVRFTAKALDEDGNELEDRPVSWSTSNSSIVSINSQGVATARFLGAVTITATIEGKTANAPVAVGIHPVHTVTVTPPSPRLYVGDSLQLQATLKSAGGLVLQGRSIQWRSSSNSIASVDPSGRVTARKAGKVTVTATSEGRSGSATVTVEHRPVATVEVNPATLKLVAGDAETLTAVLRAADGTVLEGRKVSWKSSDDHVAEARDNGRVTARKPGKATITAESEGKSGSAEVTVTGPPVSSVEVQPPFLELREGESASFEVTLKDDDGDVLTDREVEWESSEPAIAGVEDGVVTAHAAGEATITVTSVPEAPGEEARTGAAEVMVLARVASIEVDPTSVEIFEGFSHSVRATLRAADGTELTGRSIEWSSSDESVAKVEAVDDHSVEISGEGAGQATITATSEGISGSVDVQVNPQAASLSSVRGDRQFGVNNRPLNDPLIVRAFDANGNPLAGVLVSWSTQAGSFDPKESLTLEDGTASSRWTLGCAQGFIRTARAEAHGHRVNFQAFASPCLGSGGNGGGGGEDADDDDRDN